MFYLWSVFHLRYFNIVKITGINIILIAVLKLSTSYFTWNVLLMPFRKAQSRRPLAIDGNSMVELVLYPWLAANFIPGYSYKKKLSFSRCCNLQILKEYVKSNNHLRYFPKHLHSYLQIFQQKVHLLFNLIAANTKFLLVDRHQCFLKWFLKQLFSWQHLLFLFLNIYFVFLLLLGIFYPQSSLRRQWDTYSP